MKRRAPGGEKLHRILVTTAPGNRGQGALVAGGLRIRVALGAAGIGRVKREGDGRTPMGSFRLVSVFYRPDRVARPLTGLPVAPIGPASAWCDDPADPHYNRPVRLPYPGRHERLWRADRLYDLVVVLDFNLTRPRPGGGSAIFLHVAPPNLGPTEGCVGLSFRHLARLLPRIGLDTVLQVR